MCFPPRSLSCVRQYERLFTRQSRLDKRAKQGCQSIVTCRKLVAELPPGRTAFPAKPPTAASARRLLRAHLPSPRASKQGRRGCRGSSHAARTQALWPHSFRKALVHPRGEWGKEAQRRKSPGSRRQHFPRGTPVWEFLTCTRTRFPEVGGRAGHAVCTAVAVAHGRRRNSQTNRGDAVL